MGSVEGLDGVPRAPRGRRSFGDVVFPLLWERE